MDERNPIAGAGIAILDGLNAFRARNAGRDIQRIALPNGDFMLRAGNDMFSSLDPDHAPRVINLPSGEQFYEHNNFIISTIGLDPLSGEMGPGTNSFGRAFSNHWGLRDSPETFQYLLAEELQRPKRTGLWHGYIRDPNDPQDPTAITDLVYSGIIEATDTTATHPRIVISGINGYTINPDFFSDRIDRVPKSTQLSVPHSADDLWGMFKDTKYAHTHYMDWSNSGYMRDPSATDPEGPPRPLAGVLQVETPNMRTHLNAYAKGKQIVSHPTEIIPDRTAYPFAKVNHPDTDVEGHIYIPWHNEPEETRVLLDIHPDTNPFDNHMFQLSYGERFNPYYRERRWQRAVE